MSLTNFKMPKLKFKDMKMNDMEDLGEIDYLKLQKKNAKQKQSVKIRQQVIRLRV